MHDALHRKLKSRAALEGLSLSEYLINEARRSAERPSLSELRFRIQTRGVPGDEPCPGEA